LLVCAKIGNFPTGTAKSTNTANEAKTTKNGSKFKNYGKILTGKDDNKQ
jgi:hypothetical protein